MDLDLACQDFGEVGSLARAGCPKISGNGFADVLYGSFDSLSLGHAPGQLRDVGYVPLVLGVKNQVDQEALNLGHGTIIQGNLFAMHSWLLRAMRGIDVAKLDPKELLQTRGW